MLHLFRFPLMYEGNRPVDPSTAGQKSIRDSTDGNIVLKSHFSRNECIYAVFGYINELVWCLVITKVVVSRITPFQNFYWT